MVVSQLRGAKFELKKIQNDPIGRIGTGYYPVDTKISYKALRDVTNYFGFKYESDYLMKLDKVGRDILLTVDKRL